MKNKSIINEAIEIVKNYYLEEDIFEPLKLLEERAEIWSSHLNFPNPQLLAAAIIGGNYQEGLSIPDLKQWEKSLFIDFRKGN